MYLPPRNLKIVQVVNFVKMYFTTIKVFKKKKNYQGKNTQSKVALLVNSTK